MLSGSTAMKGKHGVIILRFGRAGVRMGALVLDLWVYHLKQLCINEYLIFNKLNLLVQAYQQEVIFTTYRMEIEKKIGNILLREPTTSENDDINGFVIQGHYIPYELLSKIFCFLNPKELIVCHLVCKKWNELIKEYVWRKKAEIISGQSFYFKEEINWLSYYLLCEKKPFNRNLLLSDKVDMKCHQAHRTIEFDINENPPCFNITSFPEDLVVDGKIWCTISPEYTKYLPSEREYHIDLLKEGFTENILDDVQPIIKVNVWYCCEEHRSTDVLRTKFTCAFELWGTKLDDGCVKEYIMHDSRVEKTFEYRNEEGRWFQHTAEFKNYGKGLRKITYWLNGYYYAISAGASVKLCLPDLLTSSN
ncbi:hypothetical protein TSAR_012947 [Trichomalopsis sarcophagae]|uniref:F-box domain-containing protein n=1 Tax=Trichomalopsis sarcophagae TaxID=543379 RepID=A0A232FGD1_9HYME|nr:hypothetical protein TSAR_012947 [Trichomalopsis sarcophagae]